MGKGKKGKNKNKQEEEPPTVESLSLREPSTSQATAKPDPIPEKPKETKPAAAPQTKPASAKPEPIPEKPKETKPAAAPQTKPDDDDEGGLGLGGPRKRKPKKKKEAAAEKPQETVTPSGDVPSSAASPPTGPPSVVQSTTLPDAGRTMPAWGRTPQPSGFPGGRGEPAPGPSSQAMPPGFPAPAGPSAPTPQAVFAPPSQDTRAPASVPTPATAGRGRGQPTPATAGRGRGQPTPIQPKTRVVGSPGKETPTQPKDSASALCRFKIPKKIEGRSVPSIVTRVYTNYLQMTFKDLEITMASKRVLVPALEVERSPGGTLRAEDKDAVLLEHTPSGSHLRYRYDVSFKPEIKKMVPKAYLMAKKKHFGNALIAFDQMKNCYALRALPGVPLTERFCTEVDVTDNNGRVVKFEVSFKFTGTVSLNRIRHYMATGGTSLNPPSEAIQCIDVILRQGALEGYVKAGRQFFKRPHNPIDLSGGLEMWTGLFQSAIFTSKAFINIDVAHKGFPKYQPLITTLSKDFQLDPSTPLEKQRNRRDVETFQQFLKGLRVIASIGGDTTQQGIKREFICNGTVRPASAETFEFTDPDTQRKEILTVADFFAKKKGLRLRYPHLNCVWVGPRDKSIYYPMELLHVGFGQALNRQLNENQLRTMVMKAATPPNVRKEKIEEIIKDMNYSNNQFFREFGLDISNQFYEVEARVLQPPVLEVGSGRTVTPRRGEWRQQGLLKPETMQAWGIVAVDINPNACDFYNIISMITSTARRMGMMVANEPLVRRADVNMHSLAQTLDDAKRKGVKLLFVIIGARNRDLYHRVKKVAEREVGILTQCIKENTASRRVNEQTIQNILLKVNSKLMGINQAIPERSLPRCLQGGEVMVVGADVTHPSPDQSSIPSIAAVTASIDPKCYMYNIELSIQTPKKEMIVQFEDMMVNHLMMYRQRLNSLPRKIFVFRDGVSEGQFAEVMNSELQAVHNAYYRMTGKHTKPEVLFLLVQKRHHTRLFPKNNPNYNVDPGTVVDKDIVHASELDFYLVSHQAIKGTARPTRYHAVCNDGEIRHDEVEQLTFYLCHLFSRCTRSVSYPTPTYYAHLACLRARSLTHGETFDNDMLEKEPRRLQVLENIWRISPMFFV